MAVSEKKGILNEEVAPHQSGEEGEMAELRSRGVVFEDYDFPGLKTVNHVCVLGAEKAAWFKDTEGNFLCIHEDIPQR